MTSPRSTTPTWSSVALVALLAGCTTAAPNADPSPSATPSTAPTRSAAPSGPSAQDDTAAILQAGRDRTQAMVDRDVAALDALLADGFTATHISGYEQPKAEWLEQIASGSMAYHDVQEVSATVEIDGDTAVLTTRNLVTATINGAEGTWPLESTATYEKRDGAWVNTASESTTY
ncbi:nuclear transport factor 2 family protein [Cellulomonas sp. 179-A 4D5 NHS]|uniref:nuclear transport factor 2 family protein n=1 Tax=Cellulomonas sp. 179-A 4D5 NHS TaxID=3142378 RepID=UPI0039A12A6F